MGFYFCFDYHYTGLRFRHYHRHLDHYFRRLDLHLGLDRYLVQDFSDLGVDLVINCYHYCFNRLESKNNYYRLECELLSLHLDFNDRHLHPFLNAFDLIALLFQHIIEFYDLLLIINLNPLNLILCQLRRLFVYFLQ